MQHRQGLCSLCILRGFSVSDSFVMLIGDQLALRQEASLCALCFDSAGSNCARFRGEQCLKLSL